MKRDKNRGLLFTGTDGAGQERNKGFSVIIGIGMAMILLMTGCTAMNQEQADSHTNLGVAYIQSGKYNSALKEFLQAEELGRSDTKIHYLLGIAYYGKGLNEMAISEMKKAISMDNNYSEAHNFLGTIYLSMEKWDLAIESFEKALANILYDTPAMAHYNMGWAYYKKGNYSAALQQYDLARSSEPDPVLLPLLEKNRGIVLWASGRSEEALKHLQKSVELMPDLGESYYWIGLCFMEQKNRDKAKAAFQEAVKLVPETEWSQKSKRKIEELSSGR